MSKAPLSVRLSVIVITKNEASNIQDCLASVNFADELIVVDSGSTDETAAIAQRMGAQVRIEPDWPGFGRQKNKALDLATGEWVLSLDADERITPQLATEIQNAIAAPGDRLLFDFPRKTAFCGQWIQHCGWSPDRILRLFKRGSARFNDNLVHESLQAINPSARLASLSEPMLHYSYPTPHHYWDKLKIYSQAWAEQKHQEGKQSSILRAFFASVVAFIRSYILRLGFMDGSLGFVVCQMQAQATFYKYFLLHFLNHSQKNNL